MLPCKLFLTSMMCSLRPLHPVYLRLWVFSSDAFDSLRYTSSPMHGSSTSATTTVVDSYSQPFPYVGPPVIPRIVTPSWNHTPYPFHGASAFPLYHPPGTPPFLPGCSSLAGEQGSVAATYFECLCASPSCAINSWEWTITYFHLEISQKLLIVFLILRVLQLVHQYLPAHLQQSH